MSPNVGAVKASEFAERLGFSGDFSHKRDGYVKF